jgi:pyruvate dehydrogenase E1 component beta subunit
VKTKTWRAINSALRDAMREDKSVIVFGQDVAGPGGPYGLTRGLMDEFGDGRVRDAPISEAAIAGCAIGASMMGLRPVVEIMFLDFIGLALDQLVNNAAKYRFYLQDADGSAPPLPIVIHTLYGGRASMGPQHSQSLEAWLCHVPGLQVAFPSTPQDAYGVLRTALTLDEPVIVIESISQLADEDDLDVTMGAVAPGNSRTVRSGRRLTVVSYGPSVRSCEEAIASTGVDAELIDLRWLSPWDADAVCTSVAKTSRLVIVHDAVEQAGFGAEIAATVAKDAFWALDYPIVRVGAQFSPIPVRRRDWARVLPSVDRVAQVLTEVAAG